MIGYGEFTINNTMTASVNKIAYSAHNANGEIQMTSAYVHNTGTVIGAIPEKLKPLYDKSFYWVGYYNNTDWFTGIGYYNCETNLITIYSPYQDGEVKFIRVLLDWVY